jgi:hypothetical protein
MADGSAQKTTFCIYPGNRNWKLLARLISVAISHQELARCRSTSAWNSTSVSQTSSARYRPFVYVAEMKEQTGSDGQQLAAKWRRARGRVTETRELPPPVAQSRGEGQRRAGRLPTKQTSVTLKAVTSEYEPGSGCRPTRFCSG